MSIVPSENRTHNSAAANSEMLLQVEVANARATFNAGGTSAAFAAAAKTTDIAHYRRLRASAIANGLSPADATMALRSLGTGGI